MRPRAPSGARAAIDALLEGRGEEELARLRHLLEVALGRRRPQVVALLGIHGAGKSTVGPVAARSLGLPFVELDERIEAAAGMGLADPFAFHGERFYRRLEARSLAELVAEGRPCVAALPGGIVSNDEAIALLGSACFTVWLAARPEEYWDRVFEQSDRRPVEGRENAMDDLQRLVREREPLYSQASLTVKRSGVAADEVAQRVVAGVRRTGVVG